MKKDIIILSSLILIGAVFLWATNKSRDKEGFPNYRGPQNVPTRSVTFSKPHDINSEIIVKMSNGRESVSPQITTKGVKLGTNTITNSYGGSSILFTSSSAMTHTYGGGGSNNRGNIIGTRRNAQTATSVGTSSGKLYNKQRYAYATEQQSIYTDYTPTMSLATINNGYRMVAVYDPVTGKYYDDETGEECPAPSGTYAGQIDQNTGLVWNGSAWVSPPPEVQPVGQIPWIMVLLTIIGYIRFTQKRGKLQPDTIRQKKPNKG